MNEDDRHVTGFPAYDSAGVRHAPVDRTGCFGRMAGLALAGTVLAGLGGCTFVEQTDDLFSGGPEQRMEAAKQRQSDAIDTQRRLRRTQKELAEQQAIEEQKLQEIRKRLGSWDARIARARDAQRITEAEERRLRTRVDALSNEIRAVELQVQAAHAVGETQGAAELEEVLRARTREVKQIEEEIRLLEE